MVEMDMGKFKAALRQTEAEAEARQSSFVREISIEGVAYPDWRPEETTAQNPDINLIRLAPPLRDGELCYVQFQEHYYKVGDDFVRFVCPKSQVPDENRLDESCPCCAEQYALYQSSRKTGNVQDRARSDAMRSRTAALWALLLKSAMSKKDAGGVVVPNWQIMRIGAGIGGSGRMTTHQKLCGKFDRFGDLTHPKTGPWLRVVYHMGADPDTKQPSRRFGDWDFEPTDKTFPLPKGYERGMPDLPKLLDRPYLLTDDEILSLMGMRVGAEDGQSAGRAEPEPWAAEAAQAQVDAETAPSWGAPEAEPTAEDAGWEPVTKPAPAKPEARRGRK